MTTADDAPGRGSALEAQVPPGGRGVVGPRLPNLVVAGVTKAGTTSLYRYLVQHPDICPADEKELRYFLPLRYGKPLGPPAEYASHFAASTGQTYAVEASPGYFYGGPDLPAAMAALLQEPRVVLSLREPGQRCWSFFKFMRSRAQLPQDLDFDAYLTHCEQLHADGLDLLPEHHSYSGLGSGCYARWMPQWLDTFGDDLRLEFFDDLAADPAGTVAGLCSWLGLDAEVTRTFDYPVENRSVRFRNTRLQKVALRVNKANVLFLERHQGVKRVIRGAYYLLNKAPTQESVSPAARQRLDAFFAEPNRQLAAQLEGRLRADAPAWLRR